jgi:thiamine-phosphate pyrophosphorylase
MLPRPPFLYPILDLDLLGGRPPAGVASLLVGRGVPLLQLRAKNATDRRLVEVARELLAVTSPRGVPLIVNDRPDVARIVGAAGVHVGQDDLPPREVRAVLGEGAIVGLSTHDLEQLRAAESEPVDYVAFGPIFPTDTKRAADPVVGLELLARARALTRRRLVAIGGITALTLRGVVGAGADGVAVSGAILKAEDPGAAAEALLLEIRK